jgi:two-component sensor histidine kinase
VTLVSHVIRARLDSLPPGLEAMLDIAPGPIEVSPRQASQLALIVNELATNTMK